MKKSILRITGLCAIIAALMFYNVQISPDSKEETILISVQKTALADPEMGGQGCTECYLTNGWTCLNILCYPYWSNPGYDCTNWVWC